jgi:choline-sulfatase
MIMADQLPAQLTGAYGHPVVKTPNLDQLADRGVKFDAAYTNCPICAPSRASMCAGRLVSNLGTYDNGAVFPSQTPTFMHHLTRSDYDVALSGKMHFIGPDQHHGFARRLTTDIYPSSSVWTPDWTEGPIPNPGTSVDQLRDAGLCKWNMQLDYDEEVHFRSLEYLRNAARHHDQPFFLCASYTHPHDPFITTQRWWDVYDHGDIGPPTTPPIPIDEIHPYDQWLQTHHMVDVYPPDEASIQNARHAFFGMVSYFDHKIGELVDELNRLGMSDDTIIVVTSDHGEMLGEHGMWFKRTYFDPSTRVPLIFAGTSKIREGHRSGQTVSLVDLFATFAELTDLDGSQEIVDASDGDSLCELLQGRTEGWKDHAISEYMSEGVVEPMRMAVRNSLKYVFVHDQPPLAFDLKSDPNELKNVVDDPNYSERLSELKQLVHHNWEPELEREKILASQRDRRYINQAGHASWDVHPDVYSAGQYVRENNSQRVNEQLRYPRVR